MPQTYDFNALAKFGGTTGGGSGWTAQIKSGNVLLNTSLNWISNPNAFTHIPVIDIPWWWPK